MFENPRSLDQGIPYLPTGIDWKIPQFGFRTFHRTQRRSVPRTGPWAGPIRIDVPAVHPNLNSNCGVTKII